MHVRAARAADRPWIETFLDENHSRRVARRGELVHPLDHPMLVAEAGHGPTGLLTYVPAADEAEILTLHAAERWRGVGTALIEAMRSLAAERGWRRLWLITTNDNVDALRFYQRRGFRVAAVRPGAVDEARRTLKPEIPEIGGHGIPIRDEIELELSPAAR